MKDKPFFESDGWDKVWATFLAILVGGGFVNYIFHYEEKPFSWVGPTIYFICFVFLIIQIKTNRTVIGWIRHYRKLKKESDNERSQVPLGLHQSGSLDSAEGVVISYYWMCDDRPGTFATISMSEADMARMDRYPEMKKQFMDAVELQLGAADHKHIYEAHPATKDDQKVFICRG